MHKNAVIISVLFLTLYSGGAQEQTNLAIQLLPREGKDLVKNVPTIQILPADIVQTSIQEFRSSSNSFDVRWTFTEAGAKKILEFREAHEAQKICTIVGDFVSIGVVPPHSTLPPGFGSYSEWREYWLKHRTEKIFGASEAAAQKILAGLKSR